MSRPRLPCPPLIRYPVYGCVYVVVHVPVRLAFPTAWILIDCVAETLTFVVIVQLVEPEPPVMVHVSAVTAQVPLVTIPTVAVWLVALALLMVNVRPVRVSPTPGVMVLAVEVLDPAEAALIT